MGKTETWRKGIEKFPKAMGDFEVDPKNISLLVVDMQNYDAHPDYGIGKNLKSANPEVADYYLPRLKVVVSNCTKLLHFFRKNKMRIFYAAFGAAMPDGSDMLPLRKMMMHQVPAFTTEDFEYQILDDLKPYPGELVVDKSTRCAFIGTSLDHKMRMMGIDTLAVVGAVTEACVASSARGAADLGYKVILVNDAAAGFSEEDHNHTMRNFAIFFGKVMDTEELIAAISEKL
jgi:nicotinamidase-related amidase